MCSYTKKNPEFRLFQVLDLDNTSRISLNTEVLFAMEQQRTSVTIAVPDILVKL